MKTNKMLPDSSISKVWENFRKMNGIVIELLANNWVAQSNGTFTNTVEYDGFTSDDILEVDLYDDGTLTETQISEYDGYITELNVEDGKIIAIATTKPTQTIKILARGEIVGEKVIVNGGGSSDINASNVSCLDKDGQVSNVQKELDEQSKKLAILDNYNPLEVSLTGVVNDSVANGECKSYTIKFEKEFNEIPELTTKLTSATTYASLKNILVSRTGFSYTKYNGATQTGFFNFTWLATSDKGFAN